MLRQLCVRRALRGEEGFTLVEVVVAMMLLTVGLVGAAAVVTMQASGGISAGADIGLAAVNRGNLMTTATMLAQQRIEVVKNSAFPPTPLTEPTITDYPGFTRTTTVNDVTGLAATAKNVTVVVTYRYQSVGSETGKDYGSSVKLATIVAQRP